MTAFRALCEYCAGPLPCDNCDNPEPAGCWTCGLPEDFSRVPPEAIAELRDYAEWLRLPKPRQEFHAWRRAKP